MQEWEKLTADEKTKHCLIDCIGCTSDLTYKATLTKFPIKSIVNNKKAETTGLLKERNMKHLTSNIL